MRQTVSSGSVKAIFLNREKVLKRVREISNEALSVFPEIREIRLFGSLSKGKETGLSDVDIFLLLESKDKNPLQRMKPYFDFFSDRLDIGVDMITATKDEMENFKEILKDSILLGKN